MAVSDETVRDRPNGAGDDGSNRKKVAQAAIDHLRARGHPGEIVFDEPRFRLVVTAAPPNGADGKPEANKPTMTHFVGLKHIYSEYTGAEGEEQTRVLQKHLWTLLDANAAPVDEVMRQVLPRLREPLYFEVLNRQLKAQVEDPAEREALTVPFRPLNETLSSHLLFDLPTSVVDVNAGRLKAWGLSYDEAFARALENLRTRFKEGLKEIATGLWASSFTEGHDAARLLIPELLQAVKPRGALVVMAPAAHLLLVADSAEESALGLMADLAKEALGDVRALSGVALIRKNEQWEPWLPDSRHPAYERLFFLALQTRANLYAQQKELLDAWHEFIGDKTVVARFSAFRTDAGEIFTSTPWTEGTATLLPHADRIDFVRNRGDTSEVWAATWDVARQVVPHLMEATGEKPERWRVAAFPTQAELEQLADQSKLPRP